MSDEIAESKPSWMAARSPADEWELARLDHEIAVAVAQYCKRFPLAAPEATDPAMDDSAHLYLATTATIYSGCRNLSEWLSVARDYQVSRLPDETRIKKSNNIVAARAIHIGAAISSLLHIAGAPTAMIADINTLLEPLRPKGAEKRAKAQKAILENPDAGVRGAAGIAETNAGQIATDRKAGSLVTPLTPVWMSQD